LSAGLPCSPGVQNPGQYLLVTNELMAVSVHDGCGIRKVPAQLFMTAGGRIEPVAMGQCNASSRKFHFCSISYDCQFRVVLLRPFPRAVVIPAHRDHDRANVPELMQYMAGTDVTRMQDQIASMQPLPHGCIEMPMCIGDYADRQVFEV